MSGASSARKRARLATLTALVCGALSGGAAAQSVFDFDDWMQRIDDGSQDLQRHIAARKRDAAAETAREIEQLYGLMEKYFVKRADSADAVRISRDGRVLAALLQKDLAGQRFAAAKTKAIEIAHGCRGCHITYKPL
jgi:hypothetical protein